MENAALNQEPTPRQNLAQLWKNLNTLNTLITQIQEKPSTGFTLTVTQNDITNLWRTKIFPLTETVENLEFTQWLDFRTTPPRLVTETPPQPIKTFNGFEANVDTINRALQSRPIDWELVHDASTELEHVINGIAYACSYQETQLGQAEVSRRQIMDAVDTLQEWGYDVSIAGNRIQILNPRLAQKLPEITINFHRPASRITSITKRPKNQPRSIRITVQVAPTHPELEGIPRTTKFFFKNNGVINVTMDEAWDIDLNVPRKSEEEQRQ